MTTMPALLYGTAYRGEATKKLVETAVACGMRGFDTACQPRSSREDLIGAALARSGVPREELFIQTKFTPLSGHYKNESPYDESAPIPEQVMQSFQVSLGNLGVSYLDSLLLHGPYDDFRDTLLAWSGLERIYEMGGARQIGICNVYSTKFMMDLIESARVKPWIVQNRIQTARRDEIIMRRFCRNHSIEFQSYYNIGRNPAVIYDPHLAAVTQTVRTISEKTREITPAQVYLHYLYRVRGIHPLISSQNPARIQQALFAVHDMPDLPPDATAKIKFSLGY
jgi:diketogulonate reductase-like aldo/keto reductase